MPFLDQIDPELAHAVDLMPAERFHRYLGRPAHGRASLQKSTKAALRERANAHRCDD